MGTGIPRESTLSKVPTIGPTQRRGGAKRGQLPKGREIIRP
jgi:hypothetical protein